MPQLLEAIVTGTVTFAATNVDDIFVLMLFYSRTNRTFHRWHVVAGQYLGFTTLVSISLLGFVAGLVVPPARIGLLGLLPIAIGIRHWMNRHQIEEEMAEARNVSRAGAISAVMSVSAVKFANGGDNIGIYTPGTLAWVTVRR